MLRTQFKILSISKYREISKYLFGKNSLNTKDYCGISRFWDYCKSNNLRAINGSVTSPSLKSHLRLLAAKYNTINSGASDTRSFATRCCSPSVLHGIVDVVSITRPYTTKNNCRWFGPLKKKCCRRRPYYPHVIPCNFLAPKYCCRCCRRRPRFFCRGKNRCRGCGCYCGCCGDDCY